MPFPGNRRGAAGHREGLAAERGEGGGTVGTEQIHQRGSQNTSEQAETAADQYQR